MRDFWPVGFSIMNYFNNKQFFFFPPALSLPHSKGIVSQEIIEFLVKVIPGEI